MTALLRRYEGVAPRYSVSYDLAVTTAPGQGREMLMPHPMEGVQVGGLSST
jgi:hypothetical protein